MLDDHVRLYDSRQQPTTVTGRITAVVMSGTEDRLAGHDLVPLYEVEAEDGQTYRGLPANRVASYLPPDTINGFDLLAYVQ